MKKTIIIIATCIYAFVFNYAQSQTWRLIGNSLTNPATQFLGTTDNVQLNIGTNNIVRMTIGNTGNIGIGTLTPAAKLDLNGQIRITDGTQGAGKVLTSDANGLASWQTPSGGSASDEWSLLGNAGTVDGTNFMGTTDNVALNFRVNNQRSGRIDPTVGNTFFGYQSAGNSAPTGTAGDWNTAYGAQSFYSYTSGYANTAVGVRALYSVTTTIFNVAVGVQALELNTASFNTATGGWSLTRNTTGFSNTATGMEALYNNTTGSNNTATGRAALYQNTDGIYNTAVGSSALSGNISSQYNTALGFNAGGSFQHGYNNVFLGANTNTDAADYYNVIACGQGTIVLSPNTARFGNASTSSYGGWANWTNVSDGRFKKNINENVPGITFIEKLRPVTYTLDASGLDVFMHKNVKDEMSDEGKAMHQKALQEKEKITYTGFIAQEVEASAKELGFDFSGVDAAKNENDVYGLRYAEFVVPLVKAVQELNAENTGLKSEVENLKNEIENLKFTIGITPSATGKEQSAMLYPNAPNPFTEKTSIKYFIPAASSKAEIKIYSADGKELKSFLISEKGNSQIEINGNMFHAGIYNYILFVDGKIASQRQMILTR